MNMDTLPVDMKRILRVDHGLSLQALSADLIVSVGRRCIGVMRWTIMATAFTVENMWKSNILILYRGGKL